MKPDISIVVRCYNEEKHIGKLLHGISNQNHKNYEIIVVDSGSTDKTLEIANEYPIKLVPIHPEQFSFGRALNMGCAEATGEFLVFASAHVYPVYCDWLSSLVTPFNNPKIAASYGKQRGTDTTYYSENQIFKRWFPEQNTPVQHSPFCNNANCAVRRSLWEEYPYDEELTGLEDLDWAKRMVELGYKLSYAADAEIIHVHEETPRQIYNRYFREAIALKHIYPEQKMSFLSFAKLYLQNTATDVAHAFLESELSTKNAKEIMMFRLMQFWGAKQGMKQQGPITEQLRQIFYYPKMFPHKTSPSKHASETRKIDYELFKNNH